MAHIDRRGILVAREVALALHTLQQTPLQLLEVGLEWVDKGSTGAKVFTTNIPVAPEVVGLG